MNALDAALKAIDAQYDWKRCDESQLLVRAKCRGLLRGYDARWRNAGWQTNAVETVVTSDFWNPTTGRKSRTFTVAGKLDAVATHSGKTYVIDHKTTSSDISDPNGSYWRQLVVEGQPSHYMLLEWLNGRKPDGAVWDVTRKPGISPKKLDKATRQSVIANGTYCGEQVSIEDRQALGNGEERESFEMYEMRLTAETLEQPDRYFQRRNVPRLDSELHEYAAEIWDIGQEILTARRTERHYRNSGACMLYGSPCQFLGICSGYDTPDSDKWKKKPDVHPELNGEVQDGRDVLTNSRLRCFQTCRRQHFFKYELGIERHEAEDRESLFFGTVFHIGLEAWWDTFRIFEEKNDGNCEQGSPVNGIGKPASSGETQLA